MEFFKACSPQILLEMFCLCGHFVLVVGDILRGGILSLGIFCVRGILSGGILRGDILSLRRPETAAFDDEIPVGEGYGQTSYHQLALVLWPTWELALGTNPTKNG